MSNQNPEKVRNFSNISDFCGSAREAGIASIALCYTDEWGPTPLEDNAVHCGPRCEMLLLTYHDGHIWRCELSGEEAERTLVQEQVSSYGLKWKERSRNNAKYNT